METGYIHITENASHEFTVEARLVKGTLWLSVWEMARLFNVYTKTIEGSLKTIFSTGLLKENEVSECHTFVNNGRECLQVLYNLEVLIFISFRISSFEARAFREWITTAMISNLDTKYDVPARISNLTTNISLN